MAIAEIKNISPGIIFKKEFHKYQHFHIKPIPYILNECTRIWNVDSSWTFHIFVLEVLPLQQQQTVRNVWVFHNSLHIIPCASILDLLKKSSSSQSGGSNGQNYLTTKMRRKTSPSVANFSPLWPDEMTKRCTAEDFVPQAIWVEGGGCSIYSLGREKKYLLMYILLWNTINYVAMCLLDQTGRNTQVEQCFCSLGCGQMGRTCPLWIALPLTMPSLT